MPIPQSGVVGLQGFVKVGYNAIKKVVFVDQFEAPYEIDRDHLHLKVVVDQSSVELFTGDGIRAITVATFPPLGTGRDLVSFSE